MLKNFKKVTSYILVLSIMCSLIAVCSMGTAQASDASVELITTNSHEHQKANDPTKVQTICGGTEGGCDCVPAIIVPGILQSCVYLQEDDQNGAELDYSQVLAKEEVDDDPELQNMVASDGSPITEAMEFKYFFDINELIKNAVIFAVPTLILSLALKRDVLLSSALTKVLDNVASPHYFNPDGTRNTEIKVDTYEYSYAEYMKVDENGENLYPDPFRTWQMDIGQRGSTHSKGQAALKQIGVEAYGERAGYDHMYYFAYPSFGDTYEIAEDLKDFIDLVKLQTGHDKVNIVFVSLGGTIGTAFFDMYENDDEVIESINRVIFGAAAMDGSKVLSDVICCNFTLTDQELLYSDFIPELLKIADDPELLRFAYLLNIVIRILPDWLLELLQTSISNAFQDSLNNLFANCSTMWGLVPSDEYDAMAETYLSGESHAALKAKTDRYHQAQLDNPETIQNVVDKGIKVFVLCGYGLAVPPILESYYTYSSDNIINVSSTSIGATVADLGETFDDDYVQKENSEEYPGYSYISPDRTVDASTCCLPDQTWFINNQSHLELNSNKDVIGMCINFALDESITSVHEGENGGYPQFNEYRIATPLRGYVNKMYTTDEDDNKVFNTSKLDAANPTDAQRAEFMDAFNDAERILASRVWDYDETQEAEWRLYEIMRELQIIPDSEVNENYIDRETAKKYETTNSILKFLSDAVNTIYGPKAFL